MATTITPFNTYPTHNKKISIATETTEVVLSFSYLPLLQERLIQIVISTGAAVTFPAETEWIGGAPTWASGTNRVIRVLRVATDKVLASVVWTA